MITRKLLIFAGFTTALAGCGEQEKALRYGPAELSHESLRPEKIAGRVLARGDYLGRPGRIEQVGEALLVLDDAADSAIHFVSARDGSHLRSHGRRGSGPGEFRSAWSVTRDPSSAQSAWIFDVQLSRLTRVDLTAEKDGTNDPQIITLGGGVNPSQPLWITDSLLVSPNFAADARLAYFGRDGRYRRAAGKPPTDGRGSPVGVLQQAWMGKLAARPAADRLVLATQYADQLELYRADGSLLKTVRGPFRFDPLFKVADAGGAPTMTFEDGIRMGYSDVAVTDAHIYALFSGRTREAYGGNSPFGRYVHIYDWEGELKKILELDTDVISIALSPDGRSLYGVAETPEPVIMVFELEG